MPAMVDQADPGYKSRNRENSANVSTAKFNTGKEGVKEYTVRSSTHPMWEYWAHPTRDPMALSWAP